jgi:sugar porter (SP) family MFS transporter
MAGSTTVGSGGGMNRLVLIMAVTAALGGLLFGYDTGIISGALLFIREDFGLSDAAQQTVVGSLLFGAVLGALIAGPLTDRAGRRSAILAAGLVFALGSLAAALATGTGILVVARFFLGLAIGSAAASVPVYIAEISPRRVRGRLVSLQQFAITLGILLSYVVGYLLSFAEAWRWMLALGAVPAVVLFVGMLFLPESPRWLIGRGREADARAIMERTQDPDEDVEELITEIKAQEREEGSGTYRELFSPLVRPALTVGVGIAFFNQLVGVNAVIYYAPTILERAGLGTSAALLSTVAIGLVNSVVTGAALLSIDRLGRRPLLLIGMSGVVLALFVLGLAYLLPSQSGFVGLILVLGLIVYIASFAASLGLGIWLLNSEVYPLKVRGKGSSAGSLTHWVLDLIIASSVLTLINTITATGMFWLYGFFGIIGILFVYRFVPETKGRTLEEVDAELMRRARRRVTA